MALEIDKWRAGFSPLERERMVGTVRSWLSRDKGDVEAFRITHGMLLQRDDESLLIYHTASRISPFQDDGIFQGPEETHSAVAFMVDGIHNFIASRVMEGVFGPGGPEFDQKLTKDIIWHALYLAKLNWEALENDPNQSETRRAYATHVIADIDMRLRTIVL